MKSEQITSVDFLEFFDKSVCLPVFFVNSSKISTLIDRGASSSFISLKLNKAEIIQSLKQVFKTDPYIM